ncbi:MAG: glucose-6-phosphate isomerase [Erysipelotrichaceae bacterium]|nr:glucose-6-phosphate isomerase [Erysipelotrichaceae bacterium]
MIRVDLENAKLNEQLADYAESVKKAHRDLHERTGKGSDFLGWVDWPVNYDKEEFRRILELRDRMKGRYDTVLVCGIGGSYLGARAAIEMINGLYPDNGIETIFIGNTFSHTYVSQVLNHIKDREVVLNVISKSGTTTETSISFRIFKQFMEEKYGDEAKDRIFATTDKARGTLKQLADRMGYETFVIPDDIGGRYSVSTAVGLLPLALSGIDIEELMKGSLKAHEELNDENVLTNPAYQYAVARRILDKAGYSAEYFITYHLQLNMIAEWWKQLFGESEGKDGKGILPTSACFSTDLHSIGQFIQEGTKTEFETVFYVDDMPLDIVFPDDEENLDNMNYLSGKKLSWVNEKAFEGTLSAHSEEGNNPNIVIHLENNSAFAFGYMIYFFFLACGMTCYLLDVNPFNQPGVEVYKKKMFRLLGKNV